MFCYEVLQKRILAVVIWSNVMRPFKDFIICLKRHTINEKWMILYTEFNMMPSGKWDRGKPSQAQLLIEPQIPYNALKMFHRFMY